MDAAISSGDAVPERRTKSWRREHEETCTRRYLSSCSNVQKVSSAGSDDYVGRLSRFAVESLNESVKSIDETVSTERDIACCDSDVNCVNSKVNTKEGDFWKNIRSNSVDNKGNEISESKESLVSSAPKRRMVKYLGGSTEDSNILDVERDNPRKSGSHDTIESLTVERSLATYIKSSKRSTYDRSYNDDNTNNVKVTSEKQYKHKSSEGSDLKFVGEGKRSSSTNYFDNSRFKNSSKYDKDFHNISDNAFGQKESKDMNMIEQKNKNSSHHVKKGLHKVDDSHSDVTHQSGRNSSGLRETNDTEHVKVGVNSQRKKTNDTDNKLSSRNRMRSDDASDSSLNAVKQFSEERSPCSQETSNVPDTMKDCVPDSKVPGNQSDVLEKTIIPGILREIKNSAYRETQVNQLETYLASCNANAFTLSNDTVGLSVCPDGKVQVVMPKQRMKLEDKLSESTNDPEFQGKVKASYSTGVGVNDMYTITVVL